MTRTRPLMSAPPPTQRSRAHAWQRPALHALPLAACAYAVLIPLQPILTLPDGSPLRLAGSDLVAPFVFLAALVRPRRRLPLGLAALAVAIVLLAVVSTLLAASDRPLSGYTIGKTLGLVYLVGLSFALVRSTDAGAEASILRALAWGALWSAIVGLGGFAAWWLAGIQTTLVSGPRVCSTMPGDPNIFCSVLAVGLLTTAMDRRSSIAGRAVRSAILIVAIFASGSRSGAGAAAVAIGAALFLRHRDAWVTAARAGVVVLALTVAATPLLLTKPGARTADMLREHVWRTFTINSRLDLYAEAWEEFRDNPVSGLGIGGFRELHIWTEGGRREQLPVHNTYLWAFVDMGVGGGLLLIGLITGAVWRCARAAVQRPAANGAAVVAAGLLAMATFNLFIDGFYQRHFWVLVACALGIQTRMGATRTVA